jgi:hypothetical protein
MYSVRVLHSSKVLYIDEGGCFLDIQKNSLCGLRVGSIQ